MLQTHYREKAADMFKLERQKWAMRHAMTEVLRNPGSSTGLEEQAMFKRVAPLSISLICRYANIIDPFWIVVNPAVAEHAEWEKSDWKLIGQR